MFCVNHGGLTVRCQSVVDGGACTHSLHRILLRTNQDNNHCNELSLEATRDPVDVLDLITFNRPGKNVISNTLGQVFPKRGTCNAVGGTPNKIVIHV